MSLIVAGVDSSGAHLFGVEDPGTSSCFDELGFICIGSGAPHAITSFITTEYTPSVAERRALYLVYEAKRRAEHAPGVGTATDIWVVGDGRSSRVPDTTMAQLNRIYVQKTGWERDKLKELDKRLADLRLPPDVRPEGPTGTRGASSKAAQPARSEPDAPPRST